MGRCSVTAAAACTLGTLGSRLPLSMPDTTLTCPFAAVDVSVDLSLESSYVPDTEKSKNLLGAVENSSSTPWLTAFGVLKTRRDEHDPAVTMSCRSRMSM